MNKRPVNIMLDEETLESLERLQGVWGGSRSDAIRRAAKVAVEALEKPGTSREVVERHFGAATPDLVTVVEERRPAVPAMMTGRQLAIQQARDRERRRGDETDQRPGNDDEL